MGRVNLQFVLMDDNEQTYCIGDDVKLTFENGECLIGTIVGVNYENEIELDCHRLDKEVHVDITDLAEIVRF